MQVTGVDQLTVCPDDKGMTTSSTPQNTMTVTTWRRHRIARSVRPDQLIPGRTYRLEIASCGEVLVHDAEFTGARGAGYEFRPAFSEAPIYWSDDRGWGSLVGREAPMHQVAVVVLPVDHSSS